MTYYFIDSKTPLPVTTGPHLINLTGGDTIFLAPGTSLMTDTAGMDVVNSDGSFDNMIINGSIYSAQANGLSSNWGTSKIQIGTSGFVYGALTGLRLGTHFNEVYGQAGENLVRNSGTIQSTGIGISTAGYGNEIINSGTISGQEFGIKQQFTPIEDFPELVQYGLIIRNTGTIEGDTAIEGSMAKELVENKGTIYGSIHLHEGADIYDGRFGSVSGHIDMGLGDDIAFGGTSDETFLGQEESIDAHFGNDIYNGGSGNDTVLFITNAAGDGGRVTVDLRATTAQDTGYGFDTFIDIENIIVQDRADFETYEVVLIGNNNDNILSGGWTFNTLEGGLGNDTLLGNSIGFDTARYSGKVGATVNLSITHAQNTGYGYDILVDIEDLIGGSGKDHFTGNNVNNQLRGNAGDDILSGEAGGDELHGGKGSDTLIGGSESDTFVFDTTIGKDVDVIKDFQAFNAIRTKDDVSDLIYLSKSIFKKLTFEVDPEVPGVPFGKLMQKHFWIGAKAHDRDDRVVYHDRTGELFYDPDGNGPKKQIKFALLSKGLLLSYHDFLVYA